MTRFFVQNFGCRATQADGAALEAQLAGRGLATSDVRETADLVILNTCTVTAEADSDARSTIRRVHRENPAARILVLHLGVVSRPHGNRAQHQAAFGGEVAYFGRVIVGE